MSAAQASAAAWSALYAALFLVAGSMLVLAVLLFIQILRGRARRARSAASQAAGPVLQQALVQFLAGNPDDGVFRQYLETQRQDVAETLLRSYGVVRGSARDRLSGLALDLTLVHDWCEEAASRDAGRRRLAFSRLAFACSYEPCRRLAGELVSGSLGDPDEEVRIAAARALTQTGLRQDVARVFDLALGPHPLTRAVLSEDLRPYAIALSKAAVPEALAGTGPDRARAALEILVAWERAIPLSNLKPLIGHPDREIRALAFCLAPLAPPDPEIRGTVLQALDDPDPEIRTRAIDACGRLQLAEALPHLEQFLREGALPTARAAAAALAAMPPEGRRILAELTGDTGANPVAAQAAREAVQ